MPALPWWWFATATAADLDSYVSAAATTGVEITGAVAPMVTELEADLRLGWRQLTARVELNLTVPLDPDDDGVLVDLPEWAMLQIGSRGPAFARLGVVNPALGLEEWDRWVNALPTTTILFDNAAGGRLAGVEAGWRLDGWATELSVFGGYDLDWASPSAGLVWNASAESWALWTGFAALTAYDALGLYTAAELYPSDHLWLSFNGATGSWERAPYADLQLWVHVVPEAVLSPAARVEAMIDPGGAAFGGAAAGVPSALASLGLRLQPHTGVRLTAEGRLRRLGPHTEPALFLTLDLFRPEPLDAYGVPDPTRPWWARRPSKTEPEVDAPTASE